MPITGWTRIITPYASVWAPGASVYPANYAPGASIYAATWTKYENGQPVLEEPTCIESPVVTGAAEVGQTLSCSTGIWTGAEPISYTYLWIRDTVGPIVGATNSTYQLQAGDLGYQVHCQVTASNVAGNGVAQSNSTATVTWVAPINTVLPVISGTTTVGQTLSTTNGTWTSATSLSYTYQWKRNGSNISGATSSTYLLVNADYNNPITVTVTATNGGGSTPATSSATSNIAEPAPVNTVAPEATGYIFEMKTLSVTTGTWNSVTTPTYSFQWKRNGNNISSATSSSYTVQEADENQNITCQVTATNTAGGTAATSNTLADWTPAQNVITPIRWLQANRKSAINTGNPVDNDLVDTWVANNIVGGTTVPYTQSTTAQKPTYKTNQLNGMPVLRFNGAGSSPGQCLVDAGGTNTVNRNSSSAIITVLKLSSFPNAYQFFACFKASNSNPTAGYSTNASFKDVFFGDDTSASSWVVWRGTTISNINNWHYLYITYNGSGATSVGNFTSSVDNSSLTLTTTASNDGVQSNIIGNYKTSTIYGWTGDIAEQIIIQTSVISSDFATYLNKKYGL